MQDRQELWFIKKTDEKSYTRQPQKTINIQRLIQGKPFWEKISSSSKREKKTLVLSDWTACTWHERQVIEMQLLLTELIEQGFSIYIWQNDLLEPLWDSQTLTDSTTRHNINPAHAEHIRRVAVQQLRVSADTLHLLDDYQLALLQGKSPTEPRSIRLSTLSRIYLSSTLIAPLLQTSKPVVRYIQQDVFNSRSTAPHSLLEAYSWLLIRQDFESLENALDYTQTTCNISNDNLASLKHLKFIASDYHSNNRPELNAAYFSRKWPTLPRLISLTIDSFIAFKALIAAIDLTQLQELRITTYTDELDLSIIASAAPNLVILTLAGGANKTQLSAQPNTRSLNKLQRLDLSNLTLSSQALAYLTSSGTLNDLCLEQITLTNGILFVLNAQHSLKTFKFSKRSNATMSNHVQSVESELINAIISGTNDLRSLSLDCDHFSHFTPSALAAMKKLRTLSIKNKFHLEPLLDLLAHGTKLISIDLSDIVSNGEEAETLVSLNELKSISLGGDLSWFNASINVPMLSDLTLESVRNTPETLPSFSTLRYVTISNIETHIDFIYQLIKSNPRLERVTFYDCTCDGDLSDLPQLPCLHTWSCASTNFTNSTLTTFMKAMPALRHLSITDDVYPGHAFVDALNCPQLESLGIEGLEFCTEDLLYWLKKLQTSSKKLKRITWGDSALDYSTEELTELLNGHFKGIADYITFRDEESQQSEASMSPTLSQSPGQQTALPNAPGTFIDADTTTSLNAPGTFIDADTTFNPNQAQTVTQLFYATQGKAHPHVAVYRHRLFTTLTLIKNPISINQAFQLDASPINTLEPVNITPTQHDVFALAPQYAQPCFYGKQPFHLNSEWQPIASLTPVDEMLCYHVENNTAVDIAYSPQNNLYYIRSKNQANNKCITLDFLITHTMRPALPNYIQELVNEIKAYGTGALKPGSHHLSGRALLYAIQLQRVGSCRHRAVVFKAWMNTRGIASRIVMNDCHAFVEINIDDHWLTCDLSGYTVKLSLSEPHKPQPFISPAQLYFQDRLRTWHVPPASTDSLQHVFSHECKNRLIHVDASALAQVRLTIQGTASPHHPVFYIHQPDDLVCTAPYLKRTASNQALWQQGGGALHDFIKATVNHRELTPVLLVNYNNFPAEDIVRCNGLLDTHPHADGLPLPDNALVIGLLDPNKPDAYQGSDFYSRFSRIENAPSLNSIMPAFKLTPMPVNAPVDRHVINLYHSSGWLSQLMGSWVIRNGELYFEQGELVRALQSNKPIELLNPPDNDDFDCFWQQAYLQHAIVYQGERIPFNNVVIYVNHEYNRTPVVITNSAASVSAQAQVINSDVFGTFMSQYQFVNGKLTKSLGIIEILAKKGALIIDLFITSALSEDEWEQLHCEAHKHHVSFRVGRPPQADKKIPWLRCIHTLDKDFTLARLTAAQHEWIIIDCSELSAGDLLETTDARWVENVPNVSFEFNKKQNALVRALNANKQVILTGYFSDTLKNELAPFLIQFASQPHSLSKIMIISEQPFEYLYNIIETPSLQVKLEYIKQYNYAEEHNFTRLVSEMSGDALSLLSFVQLQARLRYFNMNPYTPVSQAVYAGFETVRLTKPSLDPINFATVTQDANAFHELRYLKLNAAFLTTPYVYIAGLTGVGKSFFVEQVLTKMSFFQDEHLSLKDWASKRSQSDWIVLFIDEANLSQRQWSEFEGLFHNPPGILIEGTYYPLTWKHRVIFAGNPLSYGDARQVATLFQRHASALVFEPLSLAVIFESFIKPILSQAPVWHSWVKHQIATRILQTYQFFVEHAEDEILISPRQLQMILHLIVNYINQNPLSTHDHVLFMTDFYIRQITIPFVPAPLRVMFDQIIPDAERPAFSRITLPIQGPTGHYHMPSRHLASHYLVDLLNLRQALIFKKSSTGLNRVIIEGDAGIGKSEWVIDLLHMMNTPYYYLHASMHSDEKSRLLLAAFDEGRIVVIDEINAMSQMEQMMNSMLDGKHPFEQSRKPHHSGFYVIGTQNGAHLAGRALASKALQNRTITIHLTPYTSDEMIRFFLYMSLPSSLSESLVYAFEHNINEALSKHLTPAPTFRNLITLVNESLNNNRTLSVQGSSSSALSSRFFTEQTTDATAQGSAEMVRHDEIIIQEFAAR